MKLRKVLVLCQTEHKSPVAKCDVVVVEAQTEEIIVFKIKSLPPHAVFVRSGWGQR